ncbi:ribosomal protein S4 (chloroplast) [Citrus sinensis]|uniref:Small ribosomal subunit protein uS4c n=1 Tax=Citrus sinensis TaxID=2711 RepID=Q09MH6_CITSI|nr:ribosomal protein S4 [Citrus sinensis]ABI49022.1 ribosomal protein S4 [Citrus sinensis]
MSRYRGPRFKKIRRLGALPGLTSKRPRAGSDFRNQLRSVKKSQYRIRLEEKQKLRFHYGLTERQLLNMFVSPEKPKGQPVWFYYNYLKCVWITFFFDWVWLQLFLKPANWLTIDIF